MIRIRKWGSAGALFTVGAIAGGLVMFATGVFGQGSVGTLNMAADSQLNMTCPNALSNSAVQANSETVNCADNPTTTTTTASTTTTTVPATTTTTAGNPPPSGCPQFLELPSATQAFCDTLGTPDPTPGTRSGDMNGTLWGVSRYGGSDDTPTFADDWAASTQDQCGTQVTVNNTSDINTCNGMTVESQNDASNQSVLAMYPRQPFNFASGSQVVEFNVSDNSASSHAAWPDFVISSVPDPAPDGSPIEDGNVDAPNSVGVDLTGNATNLASGQLCETALIWETANYQKSVPAQTNPGCAAASTSSAPAGSGAKGPFTMNHVEVVISAGSMDVYMSDAGTLNMHLLASARFTLPLTQGLVWLEDQHYNGSKFCAEDLECQQTDTFGWSDLAFSGPLLPRDLGFDIPDNTTPGPPETTGLDPSNGPTTNIGYLDGSTVQTLADNSPTQTDINNAAGALLTMSFSWYATGTITYTVNGHANTFDLASTVSPTSSAPGGTPTTTVALPVPLREVVAGVNTFTVSIPSSISQQPDFSNLDLILQGAGGFVPPG
jgi:hypothetical protein